MILKNTFKLPENEIDAYLPKLIKLKENIKLDEDIQNKFTFINKKNSLFIPKKYEMLIFQKSKSSTYK